MGNIVFSRPVEAKLQNKHEVSTKEVQECLNNQDGKPLKDTRDKHETNPPTMWIIAETNHGRLLKVCFVVKGSKVYIKTAYEPNEDEIAIYNKYGY